jgi:hypothetical protein
MVSANFLGFAGDKAIEVSTQGTNAQLCLQHWSHLFACKLIIIRVDGSPCSAPCLNQNSKLYFWIQEACAATINKYGVGSCGPRGFYGTIDVHLHLEEHLAKFMQTQETIIYAYDLATVPSILPAFANAKDIIICDEVSDCTTPHEHQGACAA